MPIVTASAVYESLPNSFGDVIGGDLDETVDITIANADLSIIKTVDDTTPLQ